MKTSRVIHVALLLGLLGTVTASAQYTGSYQTNSLNNSTNNWAGDYVIGTGPWAHDVLIIQNAGVLSNASGYAGYTGSSNNTALITGAGSVWANSADLTVGYLSAGNLLTIANSGSVSSASGWIGTMAPAATPSSSPVLAPSGATATT